jgi:hypothetical protein
MSQTSKTKAQDPMQEHEPINIQTLENQWISLFLHTNIYPSTTVFLYRKS